MAMLAGMTRGTPDWQLDRMKEDEDARIWEEENARSNAWDRMLEAVGYLNVAVEHLDKAVESKNGAKEQIEGLPSEYRLGSLLDSLEELSCDISRIREKFIKGKEV